MLYGKDTFLLLIAVSIGYCTVSLTPMRASLIAFSMMAVTHFICHVRAWEPNTLNITGSIMCLFQRLCSLSHNLADGRRKKTGEELKRKRWSDVAVLDMPSPLRFFAYCLTPFGSFGNPFLEYKLFEYALDCGSRERISEEDRQLAFSKYFWSIPHALVQYFILGRITESIYFSSFYLGCGLIVKLAIMAVLTLAQLGRYIPAWYAVESGFIGLGLNSNEIIPADDFMNLDFTYVMMAPNCQEWMRRWNHTTHVFFKNYFYTRMLNEGYGQVFADTVVFSCASLWNGFGTHYYPMIFEAVFIMNVDKVLRETYPSEADGFSLWKWALREVWTILEMTYVPCTFYFASLRTYVQVRNTFLWAPMVLAVFVGFVCQVTRMRKARAKGIG
jgi:hypothetical protein